MRIARFCSIVVLGAGQLAFSRSAWTVPFSAPAAPPFRTAACDKVILGYYPYWNSDYRAEQIPYQNLTHICHAFLQPQADGSLLAPEGPPPYLEPELISLAHAAGVKVLCSVGGWDPAADANFRAIAANSSRRQSFAANLESFCRIYGYDGADIDWEFPQDATDRTNQNLMIQEIRGTFNSASDPAPSWSLTMAVSGGDWYGQWNDYATLNDCINFYCLMAYDGHGDWSGHMGHNAPLYQGGDPFDDVSAQAAVNYLVVTRGVPASQVVLGLPFYGYRWPTVENLYEVCSPCNATQLNYSGIAGLIGSGWTYNWDASAVVPYLTFDSGAGVISYDDAQSIEEKVAYGLTTRGLAGVFAWEISADDSAGSQPLLDAMHGAVLTACGLAPTPSPSPSPTVPLPVPTPSITPTPWRLVLDAADFNGDGSADLGLWRSSDGGWRIRNLSSVYYGLSGDIPVTGDYNGDGTAEYCIWRPLNAKWCWRGLPNVYWGTSGDIPAPADYDGDFRTDTALFRPSSGQWFIRGITRFYYGLKGDQPVPADYDGDGKDEPAVFRIFPGGSLAWYVRGTTAVRYGLAGDIPSPGDFNGDGTAAFSVFRPSVGRWYTRGFAYVTLGRSGDIPVAFDYSGDGTAERVLYRPSPGAWYIHGVTAVNFGLSSDQPAVGTTD